MDTTFRIKRWLATGFLILIVFSAVARDTAAAGARDGATTGRYSVSAAVSRQDALIEEAVHARLGAVPYTYQLQIQRVESAYARVQVRPDDRSGPGSEWVFLQKRRGQEWMALGRPARVFTQSFYDKHGIPAAIRLQNRLERNLLAEAAAYVRSRGGERVSGLELDRIERGVARVQVVRSGASEGLAYLFVRYDGRRWTTIVLGSSFDEAFYRRQGIPESLWLQ